MNIYIIRNIAYFFLLTIFFMGCKENKSASPLETELEGKVLSIGDSLGIPLSIQMIDGYLAIRDTRENTLFTMLKPDLSFCYHFGIRGDGPDELVDPSGILSIDGRQFSFYDGGKKAFVTYSIDSLLLHIDKPSLRVKAEVDGSIISHTDISDSLYITTGFFKNDNRFAVLNGKGEIIATSGTYDIEEKEKELPFHVKGVAYQSVMTRQPNHNRFALATRLGGLLEIYDFNPNDLSITKVQGGMNLFAPQLSVQNIQGTLNFVPNQETRWGYLFLASDAQHIYALYSGLYQRAGEPFISGNTVHVLDWDGTLVYQLTLDKRVRDIAVYGNKLYGLYENPDMGYEIIEYVLPDNLN